MYRISTLACAIFVFCASAAAQSQSLPPDLAGLPDQIKSLQWKTIDPAKLSALERCRALLLLNHVLDELCVNVTAEADLMSTYIQQQNLGTQFANTPPPPDPSQLAYPDAQKVAVALLRGPMSGSYYATELSDVPASALVSYEQMYGRTCQRKWSEFEESRHLVRCMGSFLGNSQKLQDYDAWATAENARREAAHQQRTPAGAQAQQQNTAQVQQLQQQLHQVQGALGAAEYQQQALAQQTAQAQQQAAAAQQQAAQAQQQASQAQQGASQAQQPYYPEGYTVPVYGGYGGYGYGAYGTAGAAAAGAYAGATAANRPTATPADAAATSQYHSANASWNRDASYQSSARAQTDQRMSSFHGAPAAPGRR